MITADTPTECTATFSNRCDGEIQLTPEEAERIDGSYPWEGYKACERGWWFSMDGVVCPQCRDMIARLDAEQLSKPSGARKVSA